MPPATSLSTTYCTEEDIQFLLSVAGETSRADDDDSGALSATESGYVTRAIQYATARVNQYLLPLYTAADLATSWTVNEMATVIAAVLLSRRRTNPVPGSLKEMYDEALDMLKALQKQQMTLADAALRNAAWPAWSNIRVDITHPLRKARVERPLSDQSPVPGDTTAADDLVGPYIFDPQRL